VVPGSIGVAAAGKSILQCPCRVPEQALTFFAFCANVEADLGLMKGPIHRQPMKFFFAVRTVS